MSHDYVGKSIGEVKIVEELCRKGEREIGHSFALLSPVCKMLILKVDKKGETRANGLLGSLRRAAGILVGLGRPQVCTLLILMILGSLMGYFGDPRPRGALKELVEGCKVLVRKN